MVSSLNARLPASKNIFLNRFKCFAAINMFLVTERAKIMQSEMDRLIRATSADSARGGGGGGTPLYGQNGDVPLDRVWFFGLSVLNRVYNFMRTCPRQGLNLS